VTGRYEIRLLPSAARQLKKLPIAVQGPMIDVIDRLADQPRPDGAKLLSGLGGGERIWRIRVGGHRILYQIQDARLVVLVVRVADRREVYDPTALKGLLKQIRGPRS